MGAVGTVDVSGDPPRGTPLDMLYGGPRNAEQLAKPYQQLVTRLTVLAEARDDLPPWDARRSGPKNCSTIVLVGIMHLGLLDLAMRRREAFDKIVRVTSTNEHEVPLMLSRAGRMMVTLDFQFQVENLLTSLAGALGIAKPPRRFPDLADVVLQRSGFRNWKRRTQHLHLASKIRNTLHNNGVHRGRTTQVTARGYTFRFIEGRVFRQAGWEHISWALHAGVDVLEELLRSPIVQAIPAAEDLGAQQLMHRPGPG